MARNAAARFAGDPYLIGYFVVSSRAEQSDLGPLSARSVEVASSRRRSSQ
jgi:hypothetical protein